MTTTQLDNMDKKKLRFGLTLALEALQEAESDESGGVTNRKLDELLRGQNRIETELSQGVQTLERDQQSLREQVDCMMWIITEQQRYLENIDHEKRAQNLIVFGIAEQEDLNAVLTDYFKTIECETESNGFTSK